MIGGKQLGFGDDEWSAGKKSIQREMVLTDVGQVVAWGLIELIEPPRSLDGRQRRQALPAGHVALGFCEAVTADPCLP